MSERWFKIIRFVDANEKKTTTKTPTEATNSINIEEEKKRTGVEWNKKKSN